MPDKYHISTKPVPPRLPRTGKCGVVDWREDCANCHNCVKKACVFDRYRQESLYIRSLDDAGTFFFECMGCFSCVQKCTKGILALAPNPAYESLGNSYWTPDIIHATWGQAETGKVPVSGGGYRGPFSGAGFDSMWTDMSEIVRPTRDGIHGREYISTAVDIGRKPAWLSFDGEKGLGDLPPLVSIPMPVIIDMPPQGYRIPGLFPAFQAAAKQTGIIMLLDYKDIGLLEDEKDLGNIALYIAPGASLPPAEAVRKISLAEISESDVSKGRIEELKAVNPELVIAVRINLDADGIERALRMAHRPGIEGLHLMADMNGNQIGTAKPMFIKDMIRKIHTTLVKDGTRDEITLIAGGGIALAEHLAKTIICGADVVSIDLPLLIGLECRLCAQCRPDACPAGITGIKKEYAIGRMITLLAAWHDQLIEVMRAMGIREARRLRGEVGRAMFFEDLEEASFGKLFGKRKIAGDSDLCKQPIP